MTLDAHSPTRLLIVDDDVGTITLLSEILRGAGELFFATSGLAAIDVARDKRPDLVLLDAELPDIDGFAVCARLKADPLTQDAAVIFVTAHSDIAHETRALDSGAVDFISKPLSPPVVRARVRTHLTLKAQADLLRRMAFVDSLTGLPNRRTFDSLLDQEWRRARRTGHPLALAMVDVDHFKQYNDHHGHQGGDDCLRAVAKALKAAARRPGEEAARYGGEEFAVILPDCDLGGARRVGDKICELVEQIGLMHGASPVSSVVTVSVGVAAMIPDGDDGPEALVAAADQALYDAKTGGRNRVGWRLV